MSLSNESGGVLYSVSDFKSLAKILTDTDFNLDEQKVKTIDLE